MHIVYDEAKRRSNIDKHGLDFADLTREFFAAATLGPAKGGRSLAVGRLGSGSVLAVVFAPLGREAISIISMRRASRKERKSS